MKESDKKKIGEAYLRLHSDDKKKPMTPEEAIKELREASDSEVRYGDTEHHYDEVMKRVEALDKAIKALEQHPCEDCISREQTLKAFAEKCAGECACCEYNGSGYDAAENCKLIKSMPSVTPKAEWIPVTERLPEKEGYYLVTATNHFTGEIGVFISWLETDIYEDGKWGSAWCNNHTENTIAWMPLPESYKAESEDQE